MLFYLQLQKNYQKGLINLCLFRIRQKKKKNSDDCIAHKLGKGGRPMETNGIAHDCDNINGIMNTQKL